MGLKLCSKSLALNNGIKMPVFGLGTWRGTPEEAEKAVYYAIKNNYRLIDCAAVYFNEGGVGKAIKKCISENIIKREDLFVVTKLWNTCHHPSQVEPSIKNSLKLLGLDYVDLYLVHFPVGFEFNGMVGEGSPESSVALKNPKTSGPKFATDAPLHKLWAAMEDVLGKGYTKSIGVSNYTIPLILDMLSYAKVMPAVNQIELHPYMPRVDLAKLCKHYNIEIMAYSPLGSGDLSLLQNEVVNKIAKKHKAGPAEVLISWSLQSGYVVIPKSTTEGHIKSNISFDFELADDEMKAINALDKSQKPLIDTNVFWGFINVNTF